LEDNKAVYKNNRKRNIIIAIIAVVTVIAAIVVAVLLHGAYESQLRSDMEYSLATSIAYLEDGKADTSLEKATEALAIAQRLNDDDSQAVISLQIRLIREIILGEELFGEGSFQDARIAYEWALHYATSVDTLNPEFIEDLIYITDAHIYFFDLMDYALSLLEQSKLEEALTAYENALLLASSLSFSEGEDLASIGIANTEMRIIQTLLATAASFEALGEVSFSNNDYAESIVHFESALEIYEILEDVQNIEFMNSRIDLAEQKIEEEKLAQERLEAQRLENQRLERQRLADERLAQQRLIAEQERQDTENSAIQESQPADTAEQVILDANYVHNRNINFDLVTLIDNQAQAPANLVLMGTTEGLNEGWYNGCGWVSAYNALIILENPIHPAEIVNYFETNQGAVMGGVLGTFPHAIERFFVDLGYDVTHTLFPQRSANLDEMIRASTVSILAYSHTRAAHFIAIEYREDLGMFIVYNDGFARRRNVNRNLGTHTDVGTAIDSINSLIRYTPEILFSFSLITIN